MTSPFRRARAIPLGANVVEALEVLGFERVAHIARAETDAVAVRVALRAGGVWLDVRDRSSGATLEKHLAAPVGAAASHAFARALCDALASDGSVDVLANFERGIAAFVDAPPPSKASGAPSGAPVRLLELLVLAAGFTRIGDNVAEHVTDDAHVAVRLEGDDVIGIRLHDLTFPKPAALRVRCPDVSIAQRLAHAIRETAELIPEMGISYAANPIYDAVDGAIEWLA